MGLKRNKGKMWKNISRRRRIEPWPVVLVTSVVATDLRQPMTSNTLTFYLYTYCWVVPLAAVYKAYCRRFTFNNCYISCWLGMFSDWKGFEHNTQCCTGWTGVCDQFYSSPSCSYYSWGRLGVLNRQPIMCR